MTLARREKEKSPTKHTTPFGAECPVGLLTVIGL